MYKLSNFEYFTVKYRFKLSKGNIIIIIIIINIIPEKYIINIFKLF